ncbi:hypothetical protein [Knoellia sp. p5-6-4]|uniref:hypothetical protein n=1 Tax=unclassified Knoellia TaxID=2618719 RepID=UPI0023DB53BD|nr:hypothetical protein [Knoellia sp. p5-6-4]MDF2146356.1 hypothetical protein [Knoellia sp. p5-6-4]
MTKTCHQCGKDRPASAFYPAPAKRDGLSSTCIACRILGIPDEELRVARIRARKGAQA